MSKRDTSFEMKGQVIDIVRGGIFKVILKDNGAIVNCTLSGKLKMNNIRIIKGDIVDVEVCIDDVTKGRITWRYK